MRDHSEGHRERLLFGSRRGAYSGATDALGHADGRRRKRCFSTRVADLPAEVQTKCFRVLETKEFSGSALRATSAWMCACVPQLGVIFAHDVPRAIPGNLYFASGSRRFKLPPLRARVEEIPGTCSICSTSLARLEARSDGSVHRGVRP